MCAGPCAHTKKPPGGEHREAGGTGRLHGQLAYCAKSLEEYTLTPRPVPLFAGHAAPTGHTAAVHSA